MLPPAAGGAQGIFLVEGKWVEAPHLSPPAEFQLAQFLLSPQEHRVVNIRTLPVGGSAYPGTLVVRWPPGRKRIFPLLLLILGGRSVPASQPVNAHRVATPV